jgi:co-chaperonin GroES (HSP10)
MPKEVFEKCIISEREFVYVKAIKKNIIVELIEKEKITEGGIILTSADREEVSKGLVLTVGYRS